MMQHLYCVGQITVIFKEEIRNVKERLQKHAPEDKKNAESCSVSTVHILPFHPLFSFPILMVAADAIMGSCTFLHLNHIQNLTALSFWNMNTTCSLQLKQLAIKQKAASWKKKKNENEKNENEKEKAPACRHISHFKNLLKESKRKKFKQVKKLQSTQLYFVSFEAINNLN